MGAKDVQQKTIFAGMGVVVGNLGDFSATVICATFKGVVVIIIAGNDSATADSHRQQTEAWEIDSNERPEHLEPDAVFQAISFMPMQLIGLSSALRQSFTAAGSGSWRR